MTYHICSTYVNYVRNIIVKVKYSINIHFTSNTNKFMFTYKKQKHPVSIKVREEYKIQNAKNRKLLQINTNKFNIKTNIK